jgi:hypothetical protein
MRKVLLSLLLIGFILWIMPLGYFIKPSREKLLCDGQRAMCMCHIVLPKSADKPLEGLWLKAGASNKENPSGGGTYFLSPGSTVLVLTLPSFFADRHFLYNNPSPELIEPVPLNKL